MENKKLKAAIIGVIYYLNEEANKDDSSKNNWASSGREMIMRNSRIVQGRGLQR